MSSGVVGTSSAGDSGTGETACSVLAFCCDNGSFFIDPPHCSDVAASGNETLCVLVWNAIEGLYPSPWDSGIAGCPETSEPGQGNGMPPKASCIPLNDCCPMLTNVDDTDTCELVVAEDMSTVCTSALQYFQTQGFCLGGGTQ